MFIHFRQQMIVRRVIIKDSKSTQHGGFTATYRTSLHLLDCLNGIKKHTQNTNVERVGTGGTVVSPLKKDMSLASIAYKLQGINFGGCYYFFQGRTVRTFSQQSRKKKKKTGRAMKSNQEAITRRKIINEKERPGKISKAPPAKIMFNRSAMDKISFKWCFVDEIGIHSYITEQLCKNDCIHCIVPWKYSILKLPVY